MDKRFLILLIVAALALICLFPMLVTDGHMPMDRSIWDWNPFADNSIAQNDSKDLTIDFLHIQQVKNTHSDSNGHNIDARYNLKFKVQSNIDTMNLYDAEVTCFDGNGNIIDTVSSHINHVGTNKIPLNCGSDIKKAELVIKDNSGNEIYKDTTEQIKVLEK